MSTPFLNSLRAISRQVILPPVNTPEYISPKQGHASTQLPRQDIAWFSTTTQSTGPTQMVLAVPVISLFLFDPASCLGIQVAFRCRVSSDSLPVEHPSAFPGIYYVFDRSCGMTHSLGLAVVPSRSDSGHELWAGLGTEMMRCTSHHSYMMATHPTLEMSSLITGHVSGLSVLHLRVSSFLFAVD